MNILIASIYSHESYSRGIMPDVLQTQIENNPGSTIYYLTNSNSFKVCYFNIEKKPEVCYRCKTGVKNTLKLVNGDFQHLRLKEIIKPEDFKIANAFFQEGIKVEFHHVFEDFEVGAATLSTYISRTRDRDLKNVAQPFVKELAVNALALYLALKRFLKERNISIVYNFNGRQEYVRAVMRASLAMKIDCYNVERTRLKGHIDFYKNSLPHDPVNKYRLVQKYWKESKLSEIEKSREGANFYKRQSSGESVVFPSYTGKMKKGELPQQIINSKKNLVVFNSSDDELAALGEFFMNPFFKDQNEGLKYLVNLVVKELSSYNLIIRMHPNLSGVEEDYVLEIKRFHQQHPNIFVIDPDSTVDSYALMDVAEKVISFGSTTGLEANFKRKPVILLGIGFFYYVDYAYKPSDKEEIEKLLVSELNPKPLLDTLKVGYFLQKGGVKTKFYHEQEIGEGVYFKNKRIPYYSLCQRIRAKFIQFVFKFFNFAVTNKI